MFLISTLAISAAFSEFSLTWGTLTLNGRLNVAAVSRARPIMLMQSGRFEVISNSATFSSRPRTFVISSPIGVSSDRISIPVARSSDIPSSSVEHIIPKLSTPRSFPFVIFTPPGRVLLCFATGTTAPSNTFAAPVTIWMGASSPTSTWHTTSLSASGCFSIFRIFPVTTFLNSSAAFSIPSTIEPDIVILCIYSAFSMPSVFI